jgi:hypothetical protein
VESAGAWAVQPDNPDRIVCGAFSYGDRTKPCGTYLFDGTTNESILMDLEPASFSVGWRPGGRGSTSPWSSGGRFIILDSWLVLDVQWRVPIDLSDAVSADFRRLDFRALQWSPGGERLAAEVSPQGYGGDTDLILVSVPSLDVEYVATLSAVAPLPAVWTLDDFHWIGEQLVAVPGTAGRPIAPMPHDALRWHARRPRPARSPRSFTDCR